MGEIRPKLILDVHLGKLAKYLRLFGFDSVYRNDFSDESLIRGANESRRTLLTRDAWLVSNFLLLFLVVSFSSSCVSLQIAEVRFENPSARLGVVPVDPTPQEAAGVQLRILPPPESLIRSREEHTLYARIKNGKGIQMQIVMDRTDRFQPGSRPDSFVVLSDATFQKRKGRLLEEVEMSSRGEILRLIQGLHRSKLGNFKITNWTRTPVFPSKPVQGGEEWSYEEKMEVRIQSRWIQEIDPQPYEMKATSRLEGFAQVRGRRCAVIKTRTFQIKHEHLKALFKELVFDIHTQIEETTYLDYANGVAVGRITETKSFTKGINFPMADTGRSQSIFYIL